MAFSLSKIFSGLTKPEQARKTAPESTVGIDIGSCSVKVLGLQQTEKAVVLSTYGQLQLGTYGQKPLGEVVTLTEQQKTSALTDVMRAAEVKSRRGALAMPLSSSFLTVVPVATNSDDELENLITVQAKKYVPLPLSDVTLDWTELASNPKVDSNVTEIMLAAIENRALTEYNNILNTIGMVGEPAEIEAFSCIRALWKKTDSTLAIIDLGGRTSKLYLVRDETLERTHRVTVGGQTITTRLAKLLDVPFEEAENLKREYTREGEHARDIYKTMATVLDRPLREFDQFMKHFEERGGAKVGRIVVVGGVANSPYLIPYMKDRWSREVELGNPFEKVGYPAFMEDTLEAIAPSFAVSLGAALREFQYTT